MCWHETCTGRTAGTFNQPQQLALPNTQCNGLPPSTVAIGPAVGACPLSSPTSCPFAITKPALPPCLPLPPTTVAIGLEDGAFPLSSPTSFSVAAMKPALPSCHAYPSPPRSGHWAGGWRLPAEQPQQAGLPLPALGAGALHGGQKHRRGAPAGISPCGLLLWAPSSVSLWGFSSVPLWGTSNLGGGGGWHFEAARCLVVACPLAACPCQPHTCWPNCAPAAESEGYADNNGARASARGGAAGELVLFLSG